PDLLFDEPRRITTTAFRQAPSPLPDPARDDRNHWLRRSHRFRFVSHWSPRSAREYGNPSRVRDRVHRCTDPAQEFTGNSAAIQDSGHALGSRSRNADLPLPDVRSPIADLDQTVRVVVNWTDDLFQLWEDSRCHCPGPANSGRRLALESSRENLVPCIESGLRFELSVGEPQCREERKNRGYRLWKTAEI